MIQIREATVSDVPLILELIHLKAAFDGVPQSVAATVEKLERTLFGTQPLAVVLLAEIEGKNAGLATYHAHYSTFVAQAGIWLDDLFVREEYRSRRVGEALMARLSRLCVQAGAARIEWSVAASNARGIQFYRRIGGTVFDGSRVVRLDATAIGKLAMPRA